MESKEFMKQEKKNAKLNKKFDHLDEKAFKKNEKAVEKSRKDTLKKAIKDAKKQEHDAKVAIKKEKKAPIKERHRLLNEPPVRSTLEEIGNAVSHGVGAILAIVALVFMLIKSTNGWMITASIVYGFSMFFMMLMSCLYHSWKSGSTVKRIWRRFDYTSIYLLIGGTFAPLLLINWNQIYGADNIWGYIIFASQWVVIITGVTMVCVFGPGRIKWLNFPLYFLIGWSGVMFIPGWIKGDLSLLWFILAGGVVYTLGMIPFAMKNVKAAHFIWHIVVVLGCVIQFLGIILFVY